MRLQPQAAPKSSQGFRSRIPGPARLSVERDKLHHARHRWQPPPLFQRGAHKAITRKQVQIQFFAAILPKTNRALKEERLQPDFGFPSQSAIHPCCDSDRDTGHTSAIPSIEVTASRSQFRSTALASPASWHHLNSTTYSSA